MNFDDLIRSYDLEYFGTGSHKMGMDKAMTLADQGSCHILDVRTREEADTVRFGFAVHIPLNEIPDRLEEIPQDKTIAVYCVSGTRSTMAAVYLMTKGYKDVKIIPENHSEIAGMVTPGFVLKGRKRITVK